MAAPDTLVFQSIRPDGVAPWLSRCLESVSAWAGRRGHAYALLGDAFFDPVPAWYVERCGPERLPVTDLARLLWARHFLAQGYGRVIWLDADVLVTAPDAFALPPAALHALGREYWLWRDAEGGLRARWKVNNCALQFRAESPLLPFYIHGCEAVVRAAASIDRLIAGPTLLSALNAAVPLPLVRDLATLSPLLIEEIVAGGADGLAAHAAAWDAPVHAVHLCRSLVTGSGGPSLIGGDRVAAAMDRLLERPGLLDR